MTNPQNEKEFIEERVFRIFGDDPSLLARDQRELLRTALSQAIQFGCTQRKEEIKSKIGMLRQWLNIIEDWYQRSSELVKELSNPTPTQEQ